MPAQARIQAGCPSPVSLSARVGDCLGPHSPALRRGSPAGQKRRSGATDIKHLPPLCSILQPSPSTQLRVWIWICHCNLQISLFPASARCFTRSTLHEEFGLHSTAVTFMCLHVPCCAILFLLSIPEAANFFGNEPSQSFLFCRPSELCHSYPTLALNMKGAKDKLQ